MTLRVLPPGGGDDGGPPSGPSEIAAALAEKLFELAERLTPPERRFAETLVETRDAGLAVIAAVPALAEADEAQRANRAMSFLSREHVQAYLQAGTGLGMIKAGLDYGAVKLQAYLLASSKNTPAYVRAQLLLGLMKEMREAGVAALQGYAVAIEKGKGKESGAVAPEELDLWLTELEGGLALPAKAGGDDAG